jgi:hypothetical protein
MYRIGLEDEKANVHVIHMTKNVVIKPHDDNMDLNCSIIGWFIKGLPIGGNFELHQLWHCFAIENGSRICLKSEKLVHKTRKFHHPPLENMEFYQSRYAFTNKKCLLN